MTLRDLWRLTATEARSDLAKGTLSSEALVRSCLDRIALRDGDVRAWTHIAPELAITQARERDKGATAGPLQGIPVGVKDVFLTRDMPTQYNSPLYKGLQAGIDAAAVALLRQAGAIVIGKTDTVEFAATGRKALTRNPHDLRRTPGGSSSGSAAAVADFHVPITLGTQTGGSMIRPASYCGVYAMKPTWNLVSNEGARKFSTSLDTVGWFARSAEDLLLVHRVFDPDAIEGGPMVLDGCRLAFLRTPYWEKSDDCTRQAFERARTIAMEVGAAVSDIDLPVHMANLSDLQQVIMLSEGRSAFLPEYRMNREALDPAIRKQVEDDSYGDRAALLEAYNAAACCRRDFDHIAMDFDGIVAPSTVGEAPIGLGFTGDLIFNGLWTLLHVPCINLPGMRGASGMPIGLTLTGPRYSDGRLLRVAAALGPMFAA